MIQKQNRKMSMSLYLAVLAVDDTLVLATGMYGYMCENGVDHACLLANVQSMLHLLTFHGQNVPHS